MLLKTIRIKNFRSCKSVEVNLEQLTALIGRNGTGKSTILNAINIFYDLSYTFKEEDFFQRNTKEKIEIELEFFDIKEKEKDIFERFIQKEKLRVVKIVEFELSTKYHGYSIQNKYFAEIRAIPNRTERRRQYVKLRDENKLPELPNAPRGWDELDKVMRSYEDSHPKYVELTTEEKQLLGATNIGGGSLDNFTKIAYIPAVHEISEETEKTGGVIVKVFSDFFQSFIKVSDEYRNCLKEFEQKGKKIFNKENIPEITKMEEDIQKMFEKYAPNASIKLGFEDFKVPKIKNPNPFLLIKEDNFECNINNKGTGLQRALLITLFEFWNKNTYILEQSRLEIEQDQIPQMDFIMLIEEPEIYLHPSMCIYLISLFEELCVTKEKSKSRMQIIFSTHSPYFINIRHFDRIRIFRKIIQIQEKIPETKVFDVTFEEFKQKWAQYKGIQLEVITRTSINTRLVSKMNLLINTGFFADMILLTEGTSDKGYLWSLQEELNLEWEKHNIIIIPIEGKTKVEIPKLIFDSFKINNYLIFDADSHNKGNKKKEKNTKKLNRNLLKLINFTSIDWPKTQINDFGAVFEDTIETYIKQTIGEENWGRIRNKITKMLGYSRNSEIDKNQEAAYYTIKEIYKNKKKLPVLEKIVNKITSKSKN